MKRFIVTVSTALADAGRAESEMRDGELRRALRSDPALALSRFTTALPERAPLRPVSAPPATVVRPAGFRTV